MPNHANRSKRQPGRWANPDPGTVRALREAHGLTRAQAAELVGANWSGWKKWELPATEPGHRRMPPGLWELFRLKVGDLTLAEAKRA